ncbi:uncharacterized protein E0L32_001171 [Thyridium curvatum]|uniref:Uncharacterized protein n=1 Tax=Thyridium curvatum TaxID=1093900 RepID=A0A507AUD9_9PEZI|nr:uncharacterized protein E0L32_001171 [Thyridium curvatum]TPX11353.1 hypothetical protein E0L32_001171 [Thyridium curvatum]
MSEQELTLGEHCVLSQVLFPVLLDAELTVIQGAVVELTQTDNGQYTATQKQLAQGTPPSQVEGQPSSSRAVNRDGQVTGYVDLASLELGVNVYVAGISLGNLYGQLQDGVGVKVDLLVVKGEIKFYLKNGNELWTYLDISISFDGSYNGDYKIVSL